MGTETKPVPENKNFRNWMKGSLAVLFAREGIAEFVENEIHDFHEDLIKDVVVCNLLPTGTICRSCTTANLLACPTQGFCNKRKKCNAHDASIPNKSPRRVCPKGLCNSLMKAVRKEHIFRHPSWKNSDARKWCTDAFEICKCFLPLYGYSDKTSLAGVNFNGLVTIIRNMSRFQCKINANLRSSNNIFEKAHCAVRDILHAPDYLLSDVELANFIDVLLDLLQDPTYLANDIKACEAAEKLEKLKNNNLTIYANEIWEVLEKHINVMFMDKKGKIVKDITDRDLRTDAIKKIQKEREKLLQQLSDANQEIEILQKSIRRREGQADVEESSIDKHKYAFMEWFFLELFGQHPSILKKHQLPIQEQFNKELVSEPSYWNFYFNAADRDVEIEPVERLKLAKRLPNQDQLNKLQIQLLETKSKSTLELLKYIEQLTTQSVLKINSNIIYAWFAYTKENNGDINVKLILEMENPRDETTLGDISYDYKVIKVKSFNDEAKLVIDKSKGHPEMSLYDLKSINMCIENNASRLMKDHKHLSIINASSVRSKGFSLESDVHTLIPENCLVLYVRKKGFIPIGELPFEDKYDGFPTDVREGMFFTHMQASNETEGILKMGSRIYKRRSPLHGGGFKCGTLGGFIDHPQYGLCGLTCAHVLLDDIEMTRLQDNGELSWLDFAPDSASVYQYEENNAERYVKIGRVVKASLTKGDNGGNGLEAAIFQIERFSPSKGLFVNVTTQDDDPLHFDSGKAYRPSRFSSALSVFKYGSTTGKTKGTFQNQLPVITVRLQSNPIPDHLVLHSQLEIKGIDGTLFSDKGDSGAMVMIDGHNGERFCIGIVEGGTSYGTTAVTPIVQILDKMDVSSLKCFEADHLRDSVRTLEETTRSLVETTRSLVETTRSLEETTRSLVETTRSIVETTRRLEQKSDEILSAIGQRNVRP